MLMKLSYLAMTAFALSLTAGCASTSGKSAAEMSPGKFVTYACEGNKSFQVRYNAEEGTARIRTHDGSAELSKSGRGLYRDDEGHWILSLADNKNTELVHKSIAKYKNCAAS
jgi:hypothetical protein